MIKSGEKTIELRLNDEKRQKLKTGDEIEFICTDEKTDRLNVKITNIYHFDNFRQLYKSLPLLKCGYTKDDISTARPDDMDVYYSPEKQRKYGVLGIEINPVAEKAATANKRRTKMSLDRLIEKIAEKQNPTVAGLDPKLDYVPASIKAECFEKYGKTLDGAAAALLEFNKALIDSLYDIVPAIKPQAAYYEMYGWQGVKALCDTISYAKSKGMFVMTDGKRNDIGTTMEAYATAHLGTTDVDGEQIEAFGADALTVNGYLGTDGIKPLANICKEKDKGIFVLVKTSNPSSGELQDMKLDTNETVYEHMGKMCENWGSELMGKYGYSAIGAVVGATYPEQLLEMREKAKHTFFLVPGYGAQGGGAEDVKNAFDKNGLGAIINSSRGIMCAWKKQGLTEEDFAKTARNEAIRMRDEIVETIGEISLK